MTKESKNKKKSKRKRPPLLIASGILLLLIIPMLTLAFFYSEDETLNFFDIGKIDITLTETNWNPNSALNIVPGTELPKNPRVINNEDLPVFVFIKVTVPYTDKPLEVSTGDNKGSTLATTPPMPLYKFGVWDADNNKYNYSETADKVQIYHDSDWKLVYPQPTVNTDDKSLVYIFAHVNPSDTTKLIELASGHTTGVPLFDSIKLVNINEETIKERQGRDNNVTVEAYGIQTKYLESNNGTTYNPVAVWEKIEPHSP